MLNTEIYIPARYWNKKFARISKDLPATFGNSKLLNEKLALLIHKVESIVYFTKNRSTQDPLNFLKKTFHPNFDVASLEDTVMEAACLPQNIDPKTNLNLYYQIDDYIKSKEKKVCKDMPRIYRNVKEHLKAFEAYRGEPITFNCLDLDFYEEFVDFLTYVYVLRRRKVLTIGLKINTIGNTIVTTQVLLSYRFPHDVYKNSVVILNLKILFKNRSNYYHTAC